MTELNIQRLIFHSTDVSNNRLHIPNIFMYGWESDFLLVRTSGFIVEFEIKCSVIDFKKDFQKTTFSWNKAVEKIPKHDALQKGEGPNYFYYVMPIEVYEKVKTLMPPWCGVLTVREGVTKLALEQDALRLHKEKITDAQSRKILHSAYYRFMNYYKLVQ